MLGPFAAKFQGTPIPRQAWGRKKSLAIAKFLLAHRGEVVSVERLAELFYEGAPVDRVLSNVRGRISEIRRALWPDRTHPDFANGIQSVPPFSYRFDPNASCWVDIEWFERYLESANEFYRQEMWQLALEEYERANALYRGDFLPEDLDEPWTAEVRERLRMAYQSSLLHTAECYIHLGQYRKAAAAARKAQALDPLDEEAYRLQIVALGHIPDKAAALSVYEELVLALRELAVEPDPQIKELVQRIRRAGFVKTGAPGPRHNLRQPLTAFFDREQELAALIEQLSNPQIRIVTLLGPGGIGKTRLAIEAGQRLAPAFRDGVFFVPVADCASAQGLAAGIAQTIGLSLNRPESGVAELADFLSNKEMLLIIDAAENVRDAAPLFDTLVGSPGIKLLVTSRIRLHFPGEFIIDVEGLPCSAAPTGSDQKRPTLAVEITPAYRLFVDRLSRLRPRFRPTEDDRNAIARICRLVEGMPLAIEMAASWGRVLTCCEIAERIAAFEALADALDDQDRSMQSVFSFSWQMLTEAERHAALRLSTFAGSFSRSAGETVADCPASTLMSLADKSFLQWDAEGRFRIHEVIRGFLRRKLAADADAAAEAHRAHAQYFARLLDSDPATGISQEQIQALRHDLPNVQQAWRWWVSHTDVETMQRTLRPVVQLHEALDQWSAVVELLEAAAASTQERLQAMNDEHDSRGKEQTLALGAALLTSLGYVSMRLRDVPRAQKALRDGKELLDALGSSAPAAAAHTQALHRKVSGWLAFERGDAAAAKAQLTLAAKELDALGDQCHRAHAISLLATLARTGGEFDLARELYEECLAIRERMGDTRAIAGVLSNLGALYGNLEQYDEAERYFNEARRYAEKGGHRLLQFFAIGNSGFLAYKRSRLDEAESLCREALDLAVDLGYKSGQAQINYYLALIALARQNPRRALPHLRQALEQSVETQALQLTLQVVHGYARYLALTGEDDEAATLLHFVTKQPAYPQAARIKSKEVLAAVASRLSASQQARAERKATERTLDEIVTDLRRLGN